MAGSGIPYRRTLEEHFGDEVAERFRVWVSVYQDHMAYYYVDTVRDAIDVIDEHGTGARAVGLEESDPHNGWITWLDDRGCDIDDLLQEREDDPENWAATLDDVF